MSTAGHPAAAHGAFKHAQLPGTHAENKGWPCACLWSPVRTGHHQLLGLTLDARGVGLPPPLTKGDDQGIGHRYRVPDLNYMCTELSLAGA